MALGASIACRHARDADALRASASARVDRPPGRRIGRDIYLFGFRQYSHDARRAYAQSYGSRPDAHLRFPPTAAAAVADDDAV